MVQFYIHVFIKPYIVDMAIFISLPEQYFKFVLATFLNEMIREPWFTGKIFRYRWQPDHQCHWAGTCKEQHLPKFVHRVS